MAQVQANICRLYSRLNEFREGDKYCDVNICVDEESFRCHRLILAATCEYFDAMFGGNFKESSAEQITLHGIEASAFAEVLRFAYTGEVIVTAENACGLILASEFLKLSFIEELCVEYIEQKIPIQNAINIFVFARATEKHSLTNVISEYIVANFLTISKTTEFLNLPFEDFRLLFDQYRGSEFRFGNDDPSLDLIVRWIDHAREERTSHLHDLMGTVNFRSITTNYLQFMVKKFFGASPSTSSADSVEFVSVNAPSIHVFVASHEDCAESQWSIFSLHPDGWHYSHTLHNTDDTTCYRMGSELENSIRNVSLDNHLYSLAYHNHRSPMQKFCRASSICLEQDSYELKTPPVIVQSFEMYVSQNDIYLYNRAISNCYLYNGELNSWLPVAPLRRRVKYACITADCNSIYVIGGQSSDSQRYDCALLQAYDSRTSAWRELPRSPDPFVDAGCCMHEGKIYVCDGVRGQNNIMNIFDPVASKWQLEASTKLGCVHYRGYYPRLVSYKGCVWMIGNVHSNLTCEVYDPVTQEWQQDLGLKRTVEQSIDRGTIQFSSSRCEEYACGCTTNPSKIVQDVIIF